VEKLSELPSAGHIISPAPVQYHLYYCVYVRWLNLLCTLRSWSCCRAECLLQDGLWRKAIAGDWEVWQGSRRVQWAIGHHDGRWQHHLGGRQSQRPHSGWSQMTIEDHDAVCFFLTYMIGRHWRPGVRGAASLLWAPPFPQIDIIGAVVIVWRLRGKNYQVCSVQYCVQQLCTVWCTHIWTD